MNVKKTNIFIYARETVLMIMCIDNFLLRKADEKKQFFTLTLRRLMSYIYGAPILDVSRSHTSTQHSR